MNKKTGIKNDMKKAPKTGDWGIMRPEVDKSKCIGCANCVSFCPEACIEMKKMKENSKNKANINYDYCKGCGVCATVCPVKAIIMKKK